MGEAKRREKVGTEVRKRLGVIRNKNKKKEEIPKCPVCGEELDCEHEEEFFNDGVRMWDLESCLGCGYEKRSNEKWEVE